MKEYICKEVPTENGGYLEIEKELIRCKDCKYYTGYECRRTKVSNIIVITNEDEYCSRAERKEE